MDQKRDLLDKAKVKMTMKKHGKSFYFAKKLLGKNLSEKVGRLYFFCRTIDDLVDESSSSDDCLEILKQVKDDLNREESSDVWVNDFLDLCQTNKIDPKLGIILIDGVLSDLGNVHIQDRNELIQYAYKVAGVVGQMMCPLLRAKQGAEQFAIDLGIAMQLTNIARDLVTDATLNRIYIPAEWLPNFSPKKILRFKGEDKPPVQAAIKELLDTSELYYQSAFQGLAYLPKKNAYAIKVAGNIYREIGVKIRKNSFDYWLTRVHTTRFEKMKITLISIISGLNRTKLNHNHFLHEPLRMALNDTN